MIIGRPTQSDGGERDQPPLNKQPGEFFFKVLIDTENEDFDKNIASLLFIHSHGNPLVISLASEDKYGNLIVKIRAVFHCMKCLYLWQKDGEMMLECSEPTQFVQGRLFILNVRDATSLVDILCWSKKFGSASVENALPLIRKATSEEERHHIIRSIIEIDDIMLSDGSFGLANHEQNTQQGKENKHVAIAKAQEYRSNVFCPNKGDENLSDQVLFKQSQKYFGKINIVGMQSSDGSFYPGFFSKISLAADVQLEHSSEEFEIISLEEGDATVIRGIKRLGTVSYDSAFVAKGKVDDDGCYHVSDDEKFVLRNMQFPSLRQATATQKLKLSQRLQTKNRTHSTEEPYHPNLEPEKNPSAINFIFCLQNGIEINLTEVFTSGVFYQKEYSTDEFFITGVFDSEGRFRASYCLTSDGYLIFGTTNDSGKFIPLSKYDERGNILPSFQEIDLSKEQHSLLERVLDIPNFPNAVEFSEPEHQVCWSCVRYGDLIDDPAFVTILSTEVLDDKKNLKAYAGGELGNSGKLFLNGRYNELGEFLPGGPPLITDNLMKTIKKDSSIEHVAMDSFYENFGIRLEERKELQIQDESEKSVHDDEHEAVQPQFEETISDYGLLSLYLSDQDDDNSIDSTSEDIQEQYSTLSESTDISQTSFGQKIEAVSSEPITSITNFGDREFQLMSGTPSPNQSIKSLPSLKKKRRSSLFRGKPTSVLLSPLLKFKDGHSTKKRGSIDRLSKKLNLPTSISANNEGKDFGKGNDQEHKRNYKEFVHNRSHPAFSKTRDNSPSRRVYSPNLSVKETLTARKGSDLDDENSHSSRSHRNLKKFRRKTEKDGASPSAAKLREKHQLTSSGVGENTLELQISNKAGAIQAPRMSTPTAKSPTVSRNKKFLSRGKRNSLPVKKGSLRKGETKDVTKQEKDHTGYGDQRKQNASTTPDDRGKPPTAKEELQRPNKKQSNVSWRDFVEKHDSEDDEEFIDVEDQNKRVSSKSAFLPPLEDFSMLNFTRSYRFSYFAVPDYVRDYNKKISSGSLKLPDIKNKKSLIKPRDSKPSVSSSRRLAK